MVQQLSVLVSDPQKAEAGYTLIEIVIALAIFTIGILAVFSMHISSIGGNAAARGVTENVTVAAAKVEELMAENYDDLTSGTGTDGDASIEWTVADNCLSGLNIDSHKCVTVTVSSTVNGDDQKAISLDFLRIPLDTGT